MKARVVVTGASSSLGSGWIQRLVSQGHPVLAISRRPPIDKEIQGCTWQKADLTQSMNWNDLLRPGDEILHLAALTHSRSPEDYDRLNHQATRHLLEAASTARAARFTLVSSRTASPQNGAYARSKWQAEEYVRNGSLPWKILRPAEVFGGSKREGVDGLIHSALTRPCVPCPVGPGATLDPIHMEDLLDWAMDWWNPERPSEPILVTQGPETWTCLEICRLASSIRGPFPIPLPLPKTILSLAALASRWLPLGMVPDQVPRLYGSKHFQKPPDSRIHIRLKDHVNQLARTLTA